MKISVIVTLKDEVLDPQGKVISDTIQNMGINNINDIIDDDHQLYLAMIKFPKIIERPIVTRGNSAIIGRPPENVIKLI